MPGLTEDVTIVIAGGGQAGALAIRTLRKEGFGGRIVLVGEETAAPYERPPLSKEQLQPAAPTVTFLIGDEELASLDVEWRCGERLVGIDRGSRKVLLAGGETLCYDKLLLCTGRRPRLPDIPGIDAPCVHTLRTIEDAVRLRSSLKPQARVLVVGGGWIGLEVAAAARSVGCKVALAEAGAQLCGRTGSQPLSDFLVGMHQARGVELHFQTSLAAIEDVGQTGCLARFTDGSARQVDVVVVGIGVVANDESARAAGIDCDRGVVVDHQCRTSDPAIFAAGDVAVLLQEPGRMLRLESWQNAQDQGIAAARAMMGQPVSYRPSPYFWSQQYDTLVQIAGACVPGSTSIARPGGSGQLMVAEFDGEGRLLGAICANAPRDFRRLRKLVDAGARIDAVRFADPETPLSMILA